jgi:hypothetical protein
VTVEMPPPTDIGDDRAGGTLRPRYAIPLRAWFAMGFLLTFLVMSLVCKNFVMHPSGRFAIECHLWEYYVRIAWYSVNSSGLLGPASGQPAAAFATGLEHVLCSAGGGAVTMIMVAVGRGIARRLTAMHGGDSR